MIFYFVTTILIIIMWCISNSLETRYKIYALITAQVTYLIVASVHKLELLRIININYFQTNGIYGFIQVPWRNQLRKNELFICTDSLLWSSSSWWVWYVPYKRYGCLINDKISILKFIRFCCLGLIRQPKWGHLKELHAVIKLCSDTLLRGVQYNYSLGQLQEVRTIEEWHLVVSVP